MVLAGLCALANCGVPAGEPVAPTKQIAVAADNACGNVRSYYANNPDSRIWVNNSALTQKGADLSAALAQSHSPAPVVDEQALSAAFLQHAGRLSAAPPGRSIVYVDTEVAPRLPCAERLLASAAQMPRLEPLLQRLAAPNIVARAIQQSQHSVSDPAAREGLAADLALARSFGDLRRAIVVDTNSALLWVIDGNRVADSMKVIVGRRGSDTPDMAALMRYAKLNPYWDIPPDLVQSRIADQVAKRGPGFLHQRGFVAVDRYGEAPNVLNAAAVDWAGVRAGTVKVGVRQRPGPTNMLGRVLFMFPNRLGIYLHDTPHRGTFDLADRHISNGCVRLERAAALYKWSFGQDLPRSAGADQRVDLPEPIPVFLIRFSPAGSRALTSLAPNSAA